MRSQVVSSLGWQGSAGAIQATAQLLVLSVLSRLLQPEAFGLLALANSFIYFSSALIQGSIRPGLIREPQLSGEYISACFSLNLFFSLIFSLVLILASQYLSIFFSLEELRDVVIAVAIIFFVSSFSTIAEALLEKSLYFKKLFYINTGSFVFVYIPVAIYLAYSSYGVWSIVFATMAQAIVKAVLLNVMVDYNFEKIISVDVFKKIFVLTGLINLAWIASLLAMNVDKWIIGKYLDVSLLGIYSLAFMAMDMPRRFFSSAVEKVFFPVFSKLVADIVKVKDSFKLASLGSNLVLIPICVFCVVNAHSIINIFFGDKWEEAVIPFQIMMSQVPLRSIVRLTDNLTTAVGSVSRLSVIKYLYLAVMLFFCFSLVGYGLIGVTIAILLSVIINYFFSLYIIKKELGITFFESIRCLRDGVILGFPILFSNLLIVNIFLKDNLLMSLIASSVISLFVVIIMLYSCRKIFSNNVQVEINRFLNPSN